MEESQRENKKENNYYGLITTVFNYLLVDKVVKA
jgi:hypothetical protein